MVARAEEPANGAEKTAGVVAPRHTCTGPERRQDLVLRVEHRRHDVEGAHHVDWAVLDREHHRLLLWQSKFLRRRVVGQVIRRRLVRTPFTQVALIEPGGGRQLANGHRTLLVQSLVKAERVADAHHRDARGTAEIR